MKALLTVAAILCSQNVFAGDLDQELVALSMVESSGGQNLNHLLITKGMHAGTKAGGRFGIMPVSGKEFLLQHPASKSLQYLARLGNPEFTKELNMNTGADAALAYRMWNKLRETRTAKQAACAWYRGAYAERCRSEEMLKNDPYVQQFESYLEGRLNVYASK